jgi:MarR family
MKPETRNAFLEFYDKILRVESWSFLTNHARVLLYIAHDPGARLRDIAASLGITERTTHAIVADLAEAGYVVKQRNGRRNRYQIEAHLPLPEPGTREPAIGDVLALLLGQTDARREGTSLADAPDVDAPNGDGGVLKPGRADRAAG